MKNNFKNISKPVVMLGLVSFFTDFASEMLYPVTPIFLAAALGSSMTVIGIIEGIAEVTAGLLKGYFGILSDKIGKRKIFIVFGYGLSGFVKPLPGIIPNVFTVLFSRTADRIGKGIRTAPRDALLAGYSNNNTGAVFGFHRSMDTLGAVIGPIIAIAILYFFPGNYSLVFIAAVVPSLFAVLFTFKVKDLSTPQKHKSKNLINEFWKSSGREYKILFAILTFFSFVNSSDVFLILKSQNISGSDTMAILGYVFYNIIYAIASYPAGIAADKLGKRKIFALGLLVFSLVYLIFAFNNSTVIIWVCFALYGIYAAFTEGIAKAWVSDIVNENFRGSAIGLLNSSMSMGMLAGSVLTGILWDNFGAAVPFLISSAVAALLAIVLFVKK